MRLPCGCDPEKPDGKVCQTGHILRKRVREAWDKWMDVGLGPEEQAQAKVDYNEAREEQAVHLRGEEA